MTILKRIIAFPFVLALLIIASVWQIGEKCCLFFVYGIELINYEREDRKMIMDIYKELKKFNSES